MEQRLARSRCNRDVFVFEHFIYSSAIHILYTDFNSVNTFLLISVYNFFILNLTHRIY